MKLCPDCSKSPLPFFVVVFIASVSAFLTWLTLSYSQFDTLERIGGSAIAFLAVGGTILHYVLGCMKRHCRHGKTSRHHHGTAH
jgi:hypothetical protein